LKKDYQQALLLMLCQPRSDIGGSRFKRAAAT
jgi:hypothetical protein